MARLSPEPYPGYPPYPDDAHTNPASFADYQAKERKFWDDLHEAEANVGDGIIGVVLTFPVADSNAAYVVVKEKPLTLQKIENGYGYDADPRIIRGTTRKDVEQVKRQNATRRKYFGKPAIRQALIAIPPVPKEH